MVIDNAGGESESNFREKKQGKPFQGRLHLALCRNSTSPLFQKGRGFGFTVFRQPMSPVHAMITSSITMFQAALLRDKQQQRFETEHLEKGAVKQLHESFPWEDQRVADSNFLYFSGYMKTKIY